MGDLGKGEGVFWRVERAKADSEQLSRVDCGLRGLLEHARLFYYYDPTGLRYTFAELQRCLCKSYKNGYHDKTYQAYKQKYNK